LSDDGPGGVGEPPVSRTSVAGGISALIRPLARVVSPATASCASWDRHGTTNYILSLMTEAVSTFHDALAEAQTLGYASGIPLPTSRGTTQSREGGDHRIDCLWCASGRRATSTARVIADITDHDIGRRSKLGYGVKLLAVAEEIYGDVAVLFHPAMIPVHHHWPCARIVQLPVHLKATQSASSCFSGRGACGGHTPSPHI